MKIFKAEILDVKLVSINRKFLTHPIYINCKEYIAGLFQVKNIFDDVYFKNFVKVDLWLHSNKDIDNCLKLIFDALTEAGIIEDDKLVISTDICISREGLKRGSKDSFYIEVKEIKIFQTKVRSWFNKIILKEVKHEENKKDKVNGKSKRRSKVNKKSIR